MKSRQHIVAIVIGSVLLVMFLVMGFLLYRKVMEYRQANAALGGALARQGQLYAREPFPSPENIDREQSNLVQIRKEFTSLLKVLSESQVEPVNQKPAAFSTQFWKIREELLAQARNRKITVPPEFAFGFQRHMGGNLASYLDVPRLTQQLLIVQDLCKILYEAKIDELSSVTREEFEADIVAGSEDAAPVVSSGRRRGGATPVAATTAQNPVVKEAGLIPDGALFGKMRFVFRFSARESVVFDILNQLARDPMLSVVTRVDLVSDEPAVSRAASAVTPPIEAMPTPAEGAAGNLGDGVVVPPAVPPPATDPSDRDQRIRYGREPKLAVTLEVDVYRFRKDDNGKQS